MAAESSQIDDIDRAILGVLALDGRASWAALGQTVALSANAAAERVRRLQRLGVIDRFCAHVDPVALGRDVRARIDVTLGSEAQRSAFEAAMRDDDQVLDAVHLTGGFDYEITIDCRGSAGLDHFLIDLKARFEIARTETRVVLRQIC